MKKIVLIVLCLSACSDKQSANENDSIILAQVGDVVITEQMLEVALKGRGLLHVGAQQKKVVFDSLVKEAAMAHQALKKDVVLNAEQLAALQYQQLKYQAQNALRVYLEENPVTDEDIAAEYDSVVKATKGLQFHVQHLLFQDEVEAVQVLDQIKSGENTFEQAMSAYVSARPQVKNVGDIGWVNLQQMPEPFHQPLQTMEADSLYSQVLISQFGAHVLFLKAKKAAEPPSLDVAKAGIKKSLLKRTASKYEQLAVAKAKVKLYKK